MSDIYINPQTGDIDLTDGSMRLTADLGELVLQSVITALRTYRGEWGPDIEFGVPYAINKNNTIQLLGEGNKNLLDFYIKEAILKEPYVTGISSFSSSLDRVTTIYTASANVTASDGSVVAVEI